MLGYIVAHWRGELSLLKSTDLNGLLLYALLVSTLVSGSELFRSPEHVYIGATVFMASNVWAIVGIYRCALSVIRAGNTPTYKKLIATFVLVVVGVVVWFVVKDLWNLFGNLIMD